MPTENCTRTKNANRILQRLKSVTFFFKIKNEILNIYRDHFFLGTKNAKNEFYFIKTLIYSQA